MRFKDYFILNERKIGTFLGKHNEAAPLYINPTISDIEQLTSNSYNQIRGFTKNNNIYIWDSSEGTHRDVHKKMREIDLNDHEFAQDPDICFYFDIVKKSPLQLLLSYSPFTGSSQPTTNMYGSERTSHGQVQLKRLLQIPCIQKLKPLITNFDAIAEEPTETKPIQPIKPIQPTNQIKLLNNIDKPTGMVQPPYRTNYQPSPYVYKREDD